MDRFDDSLVRFLVEGTRIRGGLVHLDETWRTLAERRPYAPGPRELLGQAAAAAALLAATIKFQGKMIMQASGGTALRLLVVEATSERTMRGLVRVQDDSLAADRLLDAGRLAITIDPGEERDRYQGIVALEGEPLAQSLEGYFARSEQIATRLWLAADGHRASGLLLQEMPDPGPAGGVADEDDDAWNRCVHLASTTTDAELLELVPLTLLTRLFHEERVRVFEPEPWRFRCSCARERVRTMLRAMGREELESILAEEGRISVDCEFCGARYHFDPVDFDEVFEGPEVSPAVGHTRH